jgi:hypothetical protein
MTTKIVGWLAPEDTVLSTTPLWPRPDRLHSDMFFSYFKRLVGFSVLLAYSDSFIFLVQVYFLGACVGCHRSDMDGTHGKTRTLA